MKTLFITRAQAIQLSSDLLEYARMEDSSSRDIFKGFKIQFGDLLASDLQADQVFEVTPIPDFLEIGEDR